MNNFLNKIASKIYYDVISSRIARNILLKASKLKLGKDNDRPANDMPAIEKLVPGKEYIVENDWKGIYTCKGQKCNAFTSGICIFNFLESNEIEWIEGTWADGIFYGTFVDGYFQNGRFRGTSFANSRWNTINAAWDNKNLDAWGDGNVDENGNPLNKEDIILTSDNMIIRSENVASKNKKYDNFTGLILYGKSRIYAENASFEIKSDFLEWYSGKVVKSKINNNIKMNDFTGNINFKGKTMIMENATFLFNIDETIEWESGHLKSSPLTGTGKVANFTGDFKLEYNGLTAEFHATNGSFVASILNNKPFIRWKGGTWDSGTWINGIWEKGVWNSGTWNFGLWMNGQWTIGVDKDGIEHRNPPSQWQIKRIDSTHFLGTDPYYEGIGQNRKESLTNHRERIDFFKHVARIQPDDNIFVILTNEEENKIEVLFENGYYLVANVNKSNLRTEVEKDGKKVMINLWDTLENRTGLPFTFDVYHEVKFASNKPSMTKIVDGLDVYRYQQEAGMVDEIVFITHRRPSVMDLPDKFFMHALMLTMQQMYIPSEVKQIKNFATDPKYRKVWEKKIDLLKGKNVDDVDVQTIYQDVAAIQGIYAIFCGAPSAGGKKHQYSQGFADVKDTMDKYVVDFNIFPSVQEWRRWISRDGDVPKDAYDAYFKMLRSRNVWS